MSSDRNRIVAIFAGVALVLGGGAFYYVKIFTPNEARGVAREEFKAWDQRWQSVRSCLLGDERSAKASEALAIHEMADQSFTAKTCTGSVGRLARGPGESSGISAIEEAWVDLDRSSSKLADAFSHHVMTGSSWKSDALPGAIDTMVLARAKLRDALGLPDDRKTTLAPLPVAQLVRLDPKLTQIRTDPYKPTSLGAIYFGQQNGKEVQIVMRAGTPLAIARVDGTTRGVPDTSWGASVEDGKLLVGPVIESGTIAQPAATLELPALGKDERAYAIAAVSGTAAAGKGLVVVGNEGKLLVARQDGTGAWKLEPPIAITHATAELDLDGRVTGIWSDAKRVPHARMWQAGEPDQELLIKDDPPDFSAVCLTRDKTWLAVPETIYGLSAAAPVSAMSGDGELIGCSADAAILGGRSGGYQVCTASDCHQAMLADAQHLISITDLGGKLVGVTSHGGVIGVWHEGAKEPVFYGLPEPVEIAMGRERPPMALTDGKVIDVLATVGTSYVTIRVPAT